MLANVVITARPNPHPAETTRTPSKKTTPKAISGTIFVSRYTRSVSAMMKDAATTTPRASGGAVGRSTTDSKRARMGRRPTSASEVRSAEVAPGHGPRPARRRHIALIVSRLPGGVPVGAAAVGRGDVVVAVVPGDGFVPARQQHTRQRKSTPCWCAALKASSASFAACRSGKPGTNSALSIAAPLVIA